MKYLLSIVLITFLSASASADTGPKPVTGDFKRVTDWEYVPTKLAPACGKDHISSELAKLNTLSTFSFTLTQVTADDSVVWPWAEEIGAYAQVAGSASDMLVAGFMPIISGDKKALVFEIGHVKDAKLDCVDNWISGLETVTPPAPAK